MRKWKWAALAASGALLLQVGTCTTDFVYMLMQGVATQLASNFVQQLIGTTGQTGTM